MGSPKLEQIMSYMKLVSTSSTRKQFLMHTALRSSRISTVLRALFLLGVLLFVYSVDLSAGDQSKPQSIAVCTPVPIEQRIINQVSYQNYVVFWKDEKTICIFLSGI